MIKESRVYRHSMIQLILALFVLAIVGVILLIILIQDDSPTLFPVIIFFGVVFLAIFYSMTLKTIISEDEISSQNFLGVKTLRWSEISHISGSGNGIKLHNFDGSVTVAPNEQLPHYEDVVEYIGAKRLDLFDPWEYGTMTKNLEYGLILPVIGLVTLGFGFFIMSQLYAEAGLLALLPPIVTLVISGVVFGLAFSAPQSVTVEGNSLLIKYLSSQKTVRADEVQSVELKYQQTRNGRMYFVQLNRGSQKPVKLSGLKPSLPIVYLTLKNWHKKYSTIGLTNQRN